ncbi:MAG: ComF family protein [Proteobacteria bacterium]|nr:ComF family protein [Pseudomonadota bacterium]
MAVNQMISKLVDGLYPPVCVLCGESGQAGHNNQGKYTAAADICRACQQDLVQNEPACYQCGIPLSAAGNNPRLCCADCLQSPPCFTRTLAPYLYQWPLDRLVQAFKFQGDLTVGRMLAGLIQGNIEKLANAAVPDAIIPIPLHRSRQQQRGFNQAALLAADLAKGLNIPLRENILLRGKPRLPQVELDAKARKKNIRGVFALDARVAKLPAHVALVDDVMTTGSTLSEAARILLERGVERVDCWVIARAPKPG